VKVTAAIVARNEAELLDGCMTRLGFADEVLVLDMESSDDTGRVASRHGARVVRIPAEPIVERVRNVVLEAADDADWVVMVDPDERVSARFGSQLRPILEQTNASVACYRVAIPVVAFGRRLQRGLNGTTGGAIRVVRPDSVRWSDAASAHDEPIVVGDVGDLVGYVDPIENHAFRNMAQFIDKLTRYTSSDEAAASVDRIDMGAAVRHAFRLYVRQEAWRDGLPGVVAASFAVMEAWLRDCSAWEARGYPMIEIARPKKATLVGLLALLRYSDLVRRRAHRYAYRYWRLIVGPAS
jgi:glycosyltransferase involved in cell wall biosynthesis